MYRHQRCGQRQRLAIRQHHVAEAQVQPAFATQHGDRLAFFGLAHLAFYAGAGRNDHAIVAPNGLGDSRGKAVTRFGSLGRKRGIEAGVNLSPGRYLALAASGWRNLALSKAAVRASIVLRCARIRRDIRIIWIVRARGCRVGWNAGLIAGRSRELIIVGSLSGVLIVWSLTGWSLVGLARCRWRLIVLPLALGSLAVGSLDILGWGRCG